MSCMSCKTYVCTVSGCVALLEFEGTQTRTLFSVLAWPNCAFLAVQCGFSLDVSEVCCSCVSVCMCVCLCVCVFVCVCVRHSDEDSRLITKTLIFIPTGVQQISQNTNKYLLFRNRV